MAKNPRIKIKNKWVQGTQIVMNVELNYDGTITKIQCSCGINMIKNKEQFKAFLEEVYETNAPKTAVNLEGMLMEVE